MLPSNLFTQNCHTNCNESLGGHQIEDGADGAFIALFSHRQVSLSTLDEPLSPPTFHHPNKNKSTIHHSLNVLKQQQLKSPVRSFQLLFGFFQTLPLIKPGHYSPPCRSTLVHLHVLFLSQRLSRVALWFHDPNGEEKSISKIQQRFAALPTHYVSKFKYPTRSLEPSSSSTP